MRFTWRLALGGAWLARLLTEPLALAQNVSPEDTAAARELGTEGVRLADAGDCAGAIPKLAAAEKLFHAPTTLGRLGECEIKVGKLVAGTEHLQRVVREPLPPNAPGAFVAAQKRAQETLAPALPRIARLKVHVEGPPPDKVSATIDGTPMSSALLDVARPTDPGNHEVIAAAAGFNAASARVILVDGGESSVSLKLDPDGSAASTPPPQLPGAAPAPTAPTAAALPGATPPPPPPPTAPQRETQGSSPTGAIAALVVGGVGVGVGTVFGILAMSAKSTLDGECGPTKKNCPDQSHIDSLNSDALVSDIGFGVGVVGLAVGGILLATHHFDVGKSSSPRITPFIGLGTAGVRGAFE
jgi:hypothetical protein